jgi:hypothetical protein
MKIFQKKYISRENANRFQQNSKSLGKDKIYGICKVVNPSKGIVNIYLIYKARINISSFILYIPCMYV